MWIEPVAHLSERKVCDCVKWVRATSRLSCRVFNRHFGTFGKYSDRQIRSSEKLNNCDFMSLHDYHVVCSIHTSEHSVNIRTNSAFRKLSEKFGLRINFALGHTLFFIAWIKFEFFIIFWLRHVFTITFLIIRYTKTFKISFLALSGIVIPAKMIVACSSERRCIAEGARHRLSGRIVSME